MSRLRLSDVDRERLGCPEWLERVDDPITLKEARALEAAGGDWQKWPRPGVAMDLDTTAVFVWVALFRNGVTPPQLGDLEFSLNLAYEPSPGKAPSATSTKRTRTRSGATRAGNSTRSAKTS